MLEILKEILEWLTEGETAALAVVIRTWGSSPRIPGSKMGISSSGRMAGSVSSGCVEGAVVEEALQVISSGKPRILHYGVTNDTAWEVGLSCGGELDVLVFPITKKEILFIIDHIHVGEKVYWKHNISAGDKFGQSKLSLSGNNISTSIFYCQEQEYFLDVIAPPEQLIMVGAGHITVHLCQLASDIGYKTIVIDPRKAFATQERFPCADQIIHDFPDKALQDISLGNSTAVAFLSHDPKIDDPGLKSAIGTDVFYIGALGSRKTQKERRERLYQAGIPVEQIVRIKGPIGLDLGGNKPEEIAMAILAEIIQVKYKNNSISDIGE